MKLSQFKFNLPKDLLAEYPSKNREDAKLMVVHRKTKKIEHKHFRDIINYFDSGDVMVVNDTQVFPARMYGNKEKTGARIEVFLLRELNRESRLWDVLVDPARKIRIGNKLYFGDNENSLVAEVIDNTTSRGRTLRFLFDGPYEEFKALLTNLGQTPLPKYIKRKPEPSDAERYQTVFANEGAVAAPTAGLHFSRELVRKLQIKGINFAELTLHVGLGTFRPIEVEDLTKHKMDSEEMEIPQSAADVINQGKDKGKKICVVGTTAMRAVETSVSTTKRVKPFKGWTNKFIFPPYNFSIADSMITNFHTPESSLLIMVCAFGGYDLIMKAYKEAIKEKYKFFSYGDAMLIL